MAAAARSPLRRARSPPGGQGGDQSMDLPVLVRPEEKPLGWDIPEQSCGCRAQPPPFRGVGKGRDLLQDSCITEKLIMREKKHRRE